ncbi:hypothetical protein E4U10_007491 [Claviceps purpurea]|nr:hypothetical protein E4U10_007491 [Claviceps purpurea]
MRGWVVAPVDLYYAEAVAVFKHHEAEQRALELRNLTRTMTTTDPNIPTLEAGSEKGTNTTVVAKNGLLPEEQEVEAGREEECEDDDQRSHRTPTDHQGRQRASPPTLSSRETAGVRKSEVSERTSECGESDFGSAKEPPSVASSGEGVRIRSQGLSDSTGKKYKEIEEQHGDRAFPPPCSCNDIAFSTVQVDDGCDSYAAVSERFMQRLGLERFALPNPRRLCTAVDTQRAATKSVLAGGPATDPTFGPVPSRCGWMGVPSGGLCDSWPHSGLHLGGPLARQERDRVACGRTSTGGGFAQSSGCPIPRRSGDGKPHGGNAWVSLRRSFAGMVRRAAMDGTEIRLSATSLREITTVFSQSLGPPTVEEEDVALRLPSELREFADLFRKEKANALTPPSG